MDLATAIELGLPTSRQGFGTYQIARAGRKTVACVIGTAYLGVMGRVHRRGETSIALTLRETFPALSEPLPSGVRKPCNCPMSQEVHLIRLMTHLNDRHHWPRERFVTWLREEGLA